MRRFLVILVCTLGGSSYGQNAILIARQYTSSVVMVITQDEHRQNLALGSGLVVEDGKVLTNHHVIEGARFAKVIGVDGGAFPVDGLLASDPIHDLAVLAVAGVQKKLGRLSSDSVVVGQRIYAIGSPEGLSSSISEGIVSGRRRLSGSDLIQITAPISPGSSGGPIVDDKGGVVGIAVGAMADGQNLNFSIPISFALPLLKQSAVIPLSAANTESKKQSNGQTEIAKNGLTTIEVEHDCEAWQHLNECRLTGLSLRNNLDRAIGRIRIRFVLYNAKGLPLDYAEVTLCEKQIPASTFGLEPKREAGECVGVLPGLSTYYDFSRCIMYYDGVPRVFRKKVGEKLAIYILDFEILND